MYLRFDWSKNCGEFLRRELVKSILTILKKNISLAKLETNWNTHAQIIFAAKSLFILSNESPALNYYFIRKLLALIFGNKCQENCAISNIEYLCCLENHVEIKQSIKVNTLNKSNTFFLFANSDFIVCPSASFISICNNLT